jgi:hypothetical protein
MSVLIIGNGFDLNLGFETGYKHFIKSEQFQKLLEQKNGIAQYLKSAQVLNNWIDIENEFQKFSNSFNNKYGPSYQTDIVKGWYLEIVDALVNYLSTLDYTLYDRNSVAFKLLQNLAGDTLNPDFFPNPVVLSVFDFNYTPSVSLILKELGYESKIRHVKVHGGLEKRDIVFGVSDNCDFYSDHIFLLKSALPTFPAINFTTELKDSREIHMFGHSLGNMDYRYFKDFFTDVVQAGRYYNGTKLNIYYKEDNDWDSISKRIFNLTDGQLGRFRENIKFLPVKCQ